jgi:hypothetical protein
LLAEEGLGKKINSHTDRDAIRFLFKPSLIALDTPSNRGSGSLCQQPPSTRLCSALQLSDVMVEIDNQVRFSQTLLRRPVRSEAELITLYVAVIALGSNLTMADLDKMVPEVNVAAVSQMVQHL